jgi:uncharacterized protein YukE
MYGDTEVMRKRAAQLREQGVDIRAMADSLVAQTEAVGWTGRAADSLSDRIRERAAHLRDVARRHDAAADSLETHLLEVDRLKDTIAAAERKAGTLVADARARVARLRDHDGPDDVRRLPAPEDEVLSEFVPPPRGHRDWLTVDLPGL